MPPSSLKISQEKINQVRVLEDILIIECDSGLTFCNELRVLKRLILKGSFCRHDITMDIDRTSLIFNNNQIASLQSLREFSFEIESEKHYIQALTNLRLYSTVTFITLMYVFYVVLMPSAFLLSLFCSVQCSTGFNQIIRVHNRLPTFASYSEFSNGQSLFLESYCICFVCVFMGIFPVLLVNDQAFEFITQLQNLLNSQQTYIIYDFVDYFF